MRADDLQVYLTKMYRVAAGAQVTLNKRGKNADDRQRRYWAGYRQALDDVSDALTRISEAEKS